MKSLIVDDEPLTREVLLENISWLDLGIEHVLQAENGDQALNVARANKPDIILSDIRMPQKNGLDFVRALKNCNLHCQVIFISAYCQKDYLKEAIRLAAVDFLEKPINLDEVTSAVSNAVQRIQEQTSKKQFKQQNTQEKRHLASIYNSYLSAPKKMEKDFLSAFCKTYSLKSANCATCFAISKLTITASSTMEALPILLTELNSISTHICSQAFINNRSLISLIVMSQDQIVLSQATDNAKHFLSATQIPAGYSVISLHSTSLFEGLTQAQQAFELQFYDEDDSYTCHQFKDSIMHNNDCVVANNIIDAIHCLAFKNALSELQKYCKVVKDKGYCNIDFVKTSFIPIFLAFSDLVREHPHFFSANGFSSDLHALQTAEKLSVIYGILENWIFYFRNTLSEKRYSPPLVLAVRYIALHHMVNDLKIKDVSDAAYVSTPHLCMIFKKELGTTINAYIHQLRIEHAKQLLSNLTLSLSDIAHQTGYQNANYFSKIFKRNVNQSPSEYREKKYGILI